MNQAIPVLSARSNGRDFAAPVAATE